MRSDLNDLIGGFTLLRKYGEGEVNADHDQIWAGSGDLDLADYDPDIAEELDRLNWHFDRKISRWSYYL